MKACDTHRPEALGSEPLEDGRLLRVATGGKPLATPQEAQAQLDASRGEGHRQFPAAHARPPWPAGTPRATAWQLRRRPRVAWVVTTKDASRNTFTYYMDDDGNPYNAEHDESSSAQLTISEAAARGRRGRERRHGHAFLRATSTPSHGRCWYVSTTDESGNAFACRADSSINAFNVEYN